VDPAAGIGVLAGVNGALVVVAGVVGADGAIGALRGGVGGRAKPEMVPEGETSKPVTAEDAAACGVGGGGLSASVAVGVCPRAVASTCVR